VLKNELEAEGFVAHDRTPRRAKTRAGPDVRGRAPFPPQFASRGWF
jgi:hypothetical protein